MGAKRAFVDPSVSRAKFESEVGEYRKHEDDYIGRGWWLVKAEFPQVFVVFGAPAGPLPMVPFGALIDFTDYDALPPSVSLVNPFTREPYLGAHIAFPPLPRRRTVTLGDGQPPQHTVEHLLQIEGPDKTPFICVPGIREYHEHPAHTGDSWFVHRKRGEGTLYFILNLLGTYGAGAVKGLGIQFNVMVQGPTVEEIPL